MRRPLLAAVLLAALAQGQQPASPRLEFEVASIARNPGRSVVLNGRKFSVAKRAYVGPLPAELRGIQGNRFVEPAATVADLIVDAYRVRPFQILGLPNWADFEGEAYDVQAKAPGDATPTSDQVRRMLQAMLEGRFGLKLHRERREMPVYELHVAKSGLKMKAVPAGSRGANTAAFSTVAGMIEQFLDRPLSDKTGLSGLFQNNWDQSELLRERKAAGPNAAVPSVFTAVRDQLGLELRAVKAPFEVLVVDAVNRPTPN